MGGDDRAGWTLLPQLATGHACFRRVASAGEQGHQVAIDAPRTRSAANCTPSGSALPGAEHRQVGHPAGVARQDGG